VGCGYVGELSESRQQSDEMGLTFCLLKAGDLLDPDELRVLGPCAASTPTFDACGGLGGMLESGAGALLWSDRCGFEGACILALALGHGRSVARTKQYAAVGGSGGGLQLKLSAGWW
jgi:hypothetical protein